MSNTIHTQYHNLMREILFDGKKLKDVEHAYNVLIEGSDNTRGYTKAYLKGIERVMYEAKSAASKTEAYDRYIEVSNALKAQSDEPDYHPE